MRGIRPLMAALFVSVGLAGCYSEIEESSSAPPAPTAEAEAPATTDDTVRGTTTGGGGRSTLGRAKESAKGTVRQLEERDRELQKQMEDD